MSGFDLFGNPIADITRPTQCLMGSGSVIDLIAPKADDLNLLQDLPTGLARLNRFSGQTAGAPYSVAQHCVIGADALLAETGDARLAALFLLHDAHEYVMGDITRPVTMALKSYGIAMLHRVLTDPRKPDDGAGTGQLREALTRAMGQLKASLDGAIFAAAKTPLPSPQEAAIIKEMDDRMLAVELKQLFPYRPANWHEIEGKKPVRLSTKLKPWPWVRAEDEYRAALQRFCPAVTHTTLQKMRDFNGNVGGSLADEASTQTFT
ncbi:MAG: hypothetical protein AAF903_14805 [Pseudomonadota bacterium]